jgi:hypothetical protein
MTDADLDRTYTAICEAMAQVGTKDTPLFLSMLCLALLAGRDSADDVLPLVAQAQRLCGGEPPRG